MPARPRLYLRSYPIPDGMEAHASAVEEDGWDGLLFTVTQNLSMDVFGSLYLAALATSRLELGTAVTNLVTCHPGVMASSFATLHHVSGGRAPIDATVRERSDHLVAKESCPRYRRSRCGTNQRGQE